MIIIRIIYMCEVIDSAWLDYLVVGGYIFFCFVDSLDVWGVVEELREARPSILFLAADAFVGTVTEWLRLTRQIYIRAKHPSNRCSCRHISHLSLNITGRSRAADARRHTNIDTLPLLIHIPTHSLLRIMVISRTLKISITVLNYVV